LAEKKNISVKSRNKIFHHVTSSRVVAAGSLGKDSQRIGTLTSKYK
jgi:hypothetical protein